MCGVFLGAGLLHMLSESSQTFTDLGYHYPIAFFIAGITFLVFLLFEHIGRTFYQHKQDTHPSFALIATLMLSVHSFLEGAAIGVSETYSIFLLIFLAVFAHKWADGLALSLHITRSTLSSSLGLTYFGIFTCMTPLGIFMGAASLNGLTPHPLFEPIFEALASGTFLYLGTLHGLEQAVMVKQCCDLKNFSYVILGFSIMACVALLG